MSAETPIEIHGYKVIRRLGQGAASELFVVHDPDTRELFTLKRVRGRDRAARRHLAQTEREFEVGSMVDHPLVRSAHRLIRFREIVRTTEMGLLLDFVDGEPLDTERNLGVVELLNIFGDVCDAVGHLHQLGWAHADLKPGNILLGQEGPVVIDLGQACRLGHCKDRVQGTPGFMAHEQASQGPIDARTDVACIGASLYWMLAGDYGSRVLLAGGESMPLHRRLPAIPASLGRLVAACLSDDPRRRPPRVDRLGEEFRAIAHDMRGVNPPSRGLQTA